MGNDGSMVMKITKLAVAALGLVYGSGAAAAQDVALRLTCEGTLYLNSSSGSTEGKYTISLIIDRNNKKLIVDSNRVFSEIFHIYDATEFTYKLVSENDKNKKDAFGFSELHRMTGDLVLGDYAVVGDYSKGYAYGRTFKGNCEIVKAKF
jgi:hypothetical protein